MNELTIEERKEVGFRAMQGVFDVVYSIADESGIHPIVLMENVVANLAGVICVQQNDRESYLAFLNYAIKNMASAATLFGPPIMVVIDVREPADAGTASTVAGIQPPAGFFH